jgi:hypothetical protein
MLKICETLVRPGLLRQLGTGPSQLSKKKKHKYSLFVILITKLNLNSSNAELHKHCARPSTGLGPQVKDRRSGQRRFSETPARWIHQTDLIPQHRPRLQVKFVLLDLSLTVA